MSFFVNTRNQLLPLLNCLSFMEKEGKNLLGQIHQQYNCIANAAHTQFSQAIIHLHFHPCRLKGSNYACSMEQMIVARSFTGFNPQ